jgi:hypothetical protein
MSTQRESHDTAPFKLAIVIPHYQAHEKHYRQLVRCLESIKKHEPAMLAHTIILDDHSPMRDGLTDLCSGYGCTVRMMAQKTSYSNKINQGAWQAMKMGYTHMVTLNNDVEVTVPFFDLLKESFAVHPRIKVIGGLLVYPTGKVQSAGFRIIHDPFTIEEYDKEAYVYAQHGIYMSGRFVEGVTGAMQAFDLNFMLAIGAYNPHYPLAFEDVEFCLRTWLKGGWVFYTPAWQGVHSESATRGKNPGEAELRSLAKIHEDCQVIDFPEIRKRIASANETFGIRL